MDTKNLENAIDSLVAKARNPQNADATPEAAMKYTQAALNVAHVLATLDNIKG